jgi:hypothetical protein
MATASIHLGHVLFTSVVRPRRILSAGSAGLCPKNRETTEQRGDGALSINPNNGEGQAKPDAPTRELTAVPGAASGDRCSNCGAPLAHDQRYCVQCGERRGQSTFPQAQPTTEVRSTRARSSGARRQPRMSSGATLLSGVAVLLVAIGLGVLIGHLGKSTAAPKGSASPVTIVQQGGGSPAATTTAASATSTPSSTASRVSKKVQAKEKAALANKTVQKKAVQAAGKVLGNGNNLAAPTVTTGSKCTDNQAGCQGGKFTGNFFGGG